MKKKLIAALCIGSMAMVLSLSVFFLMRGEDLLVRASRNVDTITMDIVYCADARTISVMQQINYRNRSSVSKDEVKFHLYANAFREGAKFGVANESDFARAFPNGQSFGHMEIESVRVENNLIEHEVIGEDENVLRVPVEGLGSGHRVNIEIIYTVYLANVAHRLGWTDSVVNLGNFYPVPVIFSNGEWMTNVFTYKGDPFFNEVHNFNVTLTRPKSYVMASSGRITSEKIKDDLKTTTVQSLAIRDWAAVLSQEFQSISRNVDGVRVCYYFLNDSEPQLSLETGVKALRTFSRLFVDFPYRQLVIVQTDFVHGGMEYGEIVFISSSITERAIKDRIIVHEIAHQWWYGIIGNDQVRTSWIDEGLAEYSTLLFFEENPEFGVASQDYINMYRNNLITFANWIQEVGGQVNFDMNRHLYEFDSQYEYAYMAYMRGKLLFVDLEAMLGRSIMIDALSHLARTNMFGIIDREDILQSLKYASGQDFALFFENYLAGEGFSVLPSRPQQSGNAFLILDLKILDKLNYVNYTKR